MSPPLLSPNNSPTTHVIEVANFEHVHLSPPPNRSSSIVDIEDHQLEYQAIAYSFGPDELRDCIVHYLNKISESIYNAMPRSRRPLCSLSFLGHHKRPLAHHPNKRVVDQPQIIGVYRKERSQDWSKHTVPWHRVETVVQVIGKKEDFQEHLVYTKHLLQARPDCPGVYGVSVLHTEVENEVQYRILWADAAGIVLSEWYTLERQVLPLPLFALVYSFYAPPNKHHLKDPTIRWTEAKFFSRARWTVKCHKREYPGCHILCAADPFDRRTMVFYYYKGDDLCVIKDAFWDPNNTQQEASVLNTIHKQGILPGVVRLQDHESVLDCNRRRIVTAASESLGISARIRNRMVLTSVGRKLTTADSIKDLLMAIYDIIEAHRSLCMDRSILHRDMSMNNILIYPQHDPASEKRFTKNPPKFISDVIRDKCKDSDRSRGLIIDFDNSASLLDKERRYKADQDLTCCVGTPIFIPRSAAITAPLDVKCFTPMPQLTGLAKSLYVQAYSQQSYDLYADSEGQCHSVPDTLKTKDQCSEYAHRPDHDVESIFWSLIYVLLQLQPLDGEDSNVSGLSEDALLAWKHLHGHRVEAATKTSLSIDTRDVLFEFCAGDWNKALHPGLSSLAPLLAKMSLQVWPEYGLLAESPPREHLHEAMRRLLLQHIVDMDDPIPLNPRNRRPVPRNVDHVTNVTGVDINGARFGWLHLPHPKEQPEGEKPKIILRVPAPKRRREGDENAEKPPDKRRKSS